LKEWLSNAISRHGREYNELYQDSGLGRRCCRDVAFGYVGGLRMSASRCGIVEPEWPLLHKFRRPTSRALIVLNAVLALVLVGLATLHSVGVISYQPASPTLDARDVDAKALRPQQQLGFQGPAHSIRLGSSSELSPLLAHRSSLHPSSQSTALPGPQNSRISGYLQQRTRYPRAPPLGAV
jgi:hypothetical protein